jgi:hypothetical protein
LKAQERFSGAFISFFETLQLYVDACLSLLEQSKHEVFCNVYTFYLRALPPLGCPKLLALSKVAIANLVLAL